MVSEEIKAQVVKLWVELDLSTRAIAKEVGLGNGTVSEILTAEKKRQPDLEELRAFNKRLKSGPSYTEVLRAANLLEEFEKQDLEFDADRLTGAGKLLKAHPDDCEGAINAGLYIIGLEESEKKPFAQIMEEARKAKEETQASRRELESLRAQREKEEERLGPLERYGRLEKELAEYGTTVGQMVAFTSFHKRLEALGFDEKSSLALANELGQRGLTPKLGAAELAEALKRHATLQSAVDDLELEVKRLDKEVQGLKAEETVLKAAGSQVEAIKGVIDTLKDAVQDLRDTADSISRSAPSAVDKTVDVARAQVVKAADEARKALEGEVTKIPKLFSASTKKIDAAASSILAKASKAESEMKRASKEIADDMDRIGKRGFETGMGVKGLEPITRVYAFMGNGEGEPEEVFPIGFSFLRTLGSWEKEHGFSVYYLDRATEETIRNWENSARR